MTKLVTKKQEAVQIGKAAKIGAVVGAVVWTGLYASLGIMLVSLGGWAWVVWPFVVYLWLLHLSQIWKAMRSFQPEAAVVAPVINVTVQGGTDLSPEKIAEAARKAVQDLQIRS